MNIELLDPLWKFVPQAEGCRILENKINEIIEEINKNANARRLASDEAI